MFQVNVIHSYLLGSGQLGKEISNVQYSNFSDRASWVVAGLGMNHVFCLTMLMAVWLGLVGLILQQKHVDYWHLRHRWGDTDEFLNKSRASAQAALEVMKQMMPPPIMLHQTDGAASCLCLWVSLSCPSAYSSHPSSIPCADTCMTHVWHVWHMCDTVRHGWCLKPVQLLNLTCSAHVKSITLHTPGEIKLEIYKLHRQN